MLFKKSTIIFLIWIGINFIFYYSFYSPAGYLVLINLMFILATYLLTNEELNSE